MSLGTYLFKDWITLIAAIATASLLAKIPSMLLESLVSAFIILIKASLKSNPATTVFPLQSVPSIAA